jgi:hypothetical protein
MNKEVKFHDYVFPPGPVNVIFIRNGEHCKNEENIEVFSYPDEYIIGLSTQYENIYKFLLIVETDSYISNIMFINCTDSFSWCLYDELFEGVYRDGEYVGDINAKVISNKPCDLKTNRKVLHIKIPDDKMKLLKDQIIHIIPGNM